MLRLIKHLKSLIYLFIILSIIYMGLASLADAKVQAKLQPKLYSIYFYADWCGNCKILSPKYQLVQQELQADFAPVLFVKMDFTNAATIQQSMLMANALGLGDFVRSRGSGTGYIAVLDQDKQQQHLIDSSNNLEQLKKHYLN